MNEQWIWFLTGFVPYYLVWGHMSSGAWIFEVRALFWRLRIENWAGGPRGWVLQFRLSSN
jgi:hypothetical protein